MAMRRVRVVLKRILALNTTLHISCPFRVHLWFQKVLPRPWGPSPFVHFAPPRRSSLLRREVFFVVLFFGGDL